MTEEKVLYKQDNKGVIRVWKIWSDSDNIIMSFGVLGGSMQEKIEHVPEGKAGRSILEQIKSRINSRISGQIDKGYVPDISKARLSKPVNVLGLPLPMLAQRYDKVNNVDLEHSFMQHKYNGHRCLITKRKGRIIAYSRNGRIISSISHITDNLSSFLSEEETIDGELYCHNTPLQDISSWVKREQENTRKLKYIVYDCIMPVPFKERLDRIFDGFIGFKNIVVAPTRYSNTIKSIKDELSKSINDGYEGLIIRQGHHGYEDGKRSRSLIKVKKCFDEEFEIVDILESVDGWAILECETKEGRIFRVSAPGTIEDKKEVLYNAESYIGEFVNIEYFELTKNGTPFHPVARSFRNISDE